VSRHSAWQRRSDEMANTFVNLAEAAALLKVHPNTVRARVREGRMPGAKVGRDWRFLEADLVAWMRLQYPDSARMQLSADQKEALWHSGNVQESMALAAWCKEVKRLGRLHKAVANRSRSPLE
jgi:excisionase family DNA binding protein